MIVGGSFQNSHRIHESLKIQSTSEKGFMEPINTMRFGGDSATQSSAENMTGCQGYGILTYIWLICMGSKSK